MGHATHFLERLERVEGQALDLALGLYRDPELLRWVFGRVGLGDHEGVVALPLNSGPKPPHVLATRAGRFVTCLGAGMDPGDVQVVRHAQLQLAMGELEAWREITATGEKRTIQVLEEWMTAGPLLAREDFEDLVVVATMETGAFSGAIHRMLVKIDRFKHSFRPRDYRLTDERSREQLAGYWHRLWAASHGSIVLTENYMRLAQIYPEREGDFFKHERSLQLITEPALCLLVGPLLRSVWCLGRLGRLVLPQLKENSRQVHFHGSHAAMGLQTMAMRHSGLRAEIEKHLLRLVPAEVRPQLTEPREHLAAYLGALQAGGPHASCAAYALQMLAQPDLCADDSLVAAQYTALTFVKALSRTAPVEGEDEQDLVDAIFSLSHSDLLPKIGRNLLLVLEHIPHIARLPASKLFLPRHIVVRLERELSMKGIPRDHVLGHLELIHARSGRGVPIKVEAKPGRNDLCTCGSGKKYKACCGR